MTRKQAFEASFRTWLDSNMPAIDGHDPVGLARQVYDAAVGGCSWRSIADVLNRVISEAKRGE